MNYEALGRYTEACEQAKTDGMNLRNALSDLSRQVSAASLQSPYHIANEIDFTAMQKAMEAAQKHYSALLEAVQRANHEAALCERKPLALYRPVR